MEIQEERVVATIYDVAQAARVSVKTVSRVLNEEAAVRPSTRERVLQSMQQLNYTPSTAARTMRTQKTGLIGVLTTAITSAPTTPDAAGLPSVNLLKGIQSVMDRSGMLMMVADTGESPERLEQLARTFREHRVEGILYVADYHQSVSPPASLFELPTVLVNCFDEHQRLPAVVPDDVAGGYRAAEAALSRGHRRIGFLTLPETMVATQLRNQGFLEAHEAWEVQVDPGLVLSVGKFLDPPQEEARALRHALEQLLNLREPPTAICCGNDKMAMSLYMQLQQWGVSIPEQLSVVGFDDYTLITELLNPRLTTVALPYVEMGQRAASRLIQEIQGVAEDRSDRIVEALAGPVIWRHSVKDLR